MKSCFFHFPWPTASVLQYSNQKQRKKNYKIKATTLMCVSIRVGFPYAIIKEFS